MRSDPNHCTPVGAPNPPAPETATEFAITALDQACWHLLNCELTLQALDGEVDLQFDELFNELGRVQREVENAFQAASLLMSRASLATSWGRLPSRPKAIFARHRAAVAESGAEPVRPWSSNAAAFVEDLELVARNGNRPAIPTSPAPQCEAKIRNGSRRCSKAALSFGDEEWASRCHIHASKAEKEGHLKFQNARAAAYQRDRQTGAQLRRKIGRSLIESWSTRGSPLALQAEPDAETRITTGDLPPSEEISVEIPSDT